MLLSKANTEKDHILPFRADFGENGQFLATSEGWTKMSSWYVMTTSAIENAEKRGLSYSAQACNGDQLFASKWP